MCETIQVFLRFPKTFGAFALVQEFSAYPS